MRILLLGLLLALAGCGGKPAVNARRSVEIVGTDYAFQVPGNIRAGPTVFSFANHGKVRHELNIFMLKRGATIEQFIALRKQNKPTQNLIDGPVGVLFADSASRSGGELSTNLIDGRDYAIICIFRDTPTAPRHFEMGMYSVIRVRGTGAPAVAEASADPVTGLDYAFRYPATLSPGHHAFAFENRGTVRHEMILLLLKKGVTTDSMLKVARNNGDTDPLIDAAPGLLTAMPGEKSLGRLEMNLLPGREYTLACFFSDMPNAPPHVALGMYGPIRVTGSPGS